MNRDFEIALISPTFPPFTIGGIASACYDLAYSLSKKGIFTTVFCGKSDKMLVEKFNSHLTVVRLPLLDAPPRHLWFQLQNFTPLLKLLKNYTLLHGFSPKASAIFAYFRKKLQKPFVTSIHGFPHCELRALLSSPISHWAVGDFVYNVLEYPLNDFLIRTCLSHSDHVVVVSFTTLHEMKEKYPDLDYNNTSVIYNGIDFNRPVFRSDCENSDEEDHLVSYFGRLTHLKGIMHLVKAISFVEKDFPDVELEIFGKGPLEPVVRRLIVKLGLTDKVYIRGFIPNTELIKKVRKASVVALPSLYEAQPTSVLEAMACKKPVVAFDLPFAHEYIKDFYNGVLVRPGDSKDLADKICILLSDRKLRFRLGQNAYEYVKRNHNWDTLVDKYIKMYDEVMNSFSS